MLAKLIVYCAYYLKSADWYRNSKLFFYDLLENSHSRKKKYFDATMICLLVLSVIFLIYDIEHEDSKMGGYFELAILMVSSEAGFIPTPIKSSSRNTKKRCI